MGGLSLFPLPYPHRVTPENNKKFILSALDERLIIGTDALESTFLVKLSAEVVDDKKFILSVAGCVALADKAYIEITCVSSTLVRFKGVFMLWEAYN